MLRKVENSATLFRWNFQESEQISSSKKFCIWSSEVVTAVSNLSEMAWRTRRWLSKSRDALNNEHGRVVMTMTSNFEKSAWRFWRQHEKADIIYSVMDGNYEYMNRLQLQIGRKWRMIRKVENLATLFRWNFQESEQISSSKKFFIWSSEAFTAFRIYRKWREELQDDCRKVEMR